MLSKEYQAASKMKWKVSPREGWFYVVPVYPEMMCMAMCQNEEVANLIVNNHNFILWQKEVVQKFARQK